MTACPKCGNVCFSTRVKSNPFTCDCDFSDLYLALITRVKEVVKEMRETEGAEESDWADKLEGKDE